MDFLVFIFAIAALVWAGILAVRTSPVLACVIYLIVACCFSGYFWSIDAAGLTWSLDRFFLIFLIAVCAIHWRQGKCDFKSLTRSDLLLGGFVLLVIIRTFTADWRTKGPDDESVLMHLINGYVLPLVIFLIARHAALDEKNLRGVYIALAGFGVYLIGTSLAEGAHAWAIVFPKYIADADLGTHFGRARGPMLQSARLGLYLTACAAATVALFAMRGKWTRQAVVTTAIVLPLYLAAMYFTYTRSVWLGAALVTMIVLAAVLSNRWRAVAFVAALGGAVMLVAVKGESLVAFERDTSASETAESTYMRASFAYVSWLMFQDHPITGVGFGQYPVESTYYLGDRSTSLPLEQVRGYIHHNTYLSVLVELGIFGLVLLLAVYALWIRQAWQLWRNESLPIWVRTHSLLFLAVLTPLLLQMLFREVSYAPIENGLVFLFAGTMTSLHATYARGAESKIPKLNLLAPQMEATG